MEAPSIGMIPSGYKDGKLYSVYPLEGLGEELVTNGTFNTDLSNWTESNVTAQRDTFVFPNGSAKVTVVSGHYTFIKQTITGLTVGKIYRLNADLFTPNTNTNTDVATIGISESGFNSTNSISTDATETIQNKSLYFTASSTSQIIYLSVVMANYAQFGTSGSVGYFDNISVKEDTSADMDFQRGSLATRVNAQGLVEDVNIISEELVQNGNFDEIGSEEVSNGDFSQEGSELVTNGNFLSNTAAGWNDWFNITNPNNSSQQDGYGILDATTGTADARQQPAVTPGKMYKIQVTLKEDEGANAKFYMSDGANYNYAFGNFVATTTETTFVKYVVPTQTVIRLYAYNTGPAKAYFKDISVVEVGQDWNWVDGWSINDGVATCTDFNNSLTQDVGVSAGKSYKVTLDVTEYISGTLYLDIGGSSSQTASSVGSKTFYFQTSSTGHLRFYGGSFRGSIDNISVKEVGQNWTFGNGASMGDDVATIVGDGSVAGYILQNNVFESNKLYKCVFDVTINSGLGLKFQDGLAYNPHNESIGFATTSGVHTFYFNSSTYSQLVISRRTGGTAYDSTINSISIKVITDATDLPRLNYDNITWQDTYSDELITNGGFDTDSDWTKGTGWSIANGKANSINTLGFELSQPITYVSGKIYKVTYTISNYVSGSIRVYYGGTGVGIERNADGTYTDYIAASGSQTFFVRSITAFTGSIDNVSVKEITGQEVASSGCPSLLLESQSTNLITYSEDFSQWSLSEGTLTANYGISPDGTQNSTRYVFSGANQQLRENVTTSASSTGSIYVKGISGETIKFGVKNSESLFTLNGEWQRIQKQGTTTSNIIVVNTYSGATARDIQIWGAQLEELPYASSYIPTNGSVQTRLADSASRSGLQDHINSEEGVLYAEIAALSDDGTDKRIALSDGTMNNYVSIGYSRFSGNIISEMYSGGVLQTVNWGATGVNKTNNNKFALSWGGGTMKFYVNGTQTNTENVTSPIGLNVLEFSDAIHTLNMYGKLKDLRVYKTALSDEELTNLTS